jgi:hypothetical protein
MAVSDWTVDTLREYLLSLITQREQAMLAEMRAQREAVISDLRALREVVASLKELTNLATTNAERAIQKAETATEKRFEAVNEFRATLADQQRTLMPRAESTLRWEAVSARVDENANRLTELEGRKHGFAGGWGWAVAVVGLIAVLVTVILALRR